MSIAYSKVILVVFLLLSTLLSAQEKRVFNFAPLPTKKAERNIEDFLPLSMQIKETLNIEINYVYKRDYKDILDGFIDGSIDIAYLGPLPFITLQKEYPFVQPIVTFKQKDGSAKYRCVLSKFKNDTFNSSKQIKVALTQPLSTCGYLMSSILLKEHYNISLEQQKYRYTMSHTNALLSVVKGEFLVAGAKESIANSFESLGMEVIAKSELLPGFSLVVNTKTLSKQQIKAIQETLLSIPQERYKELSGISQYGLEKSSIDDYRSLQVELAIPQKGNF